jgi:hypothetical protein
MPSTTDLLTLTLVLTATAAVGAANHDGRKVRRLRRGSQVTQIDNLNAVPTKKIVGGLEEDVEFWTNMVRKTQYMSLPPVPVPTPSLPPVGSGSLPPVVVEPPTSSLPPASSEPPVVVEPPVSSLPPVISEPPVSSEPPVVVEPPVSSLPPVSSEPPVVSTTPPVASTLPPIATTTPPVAAPVPSIPPVASEPPVVVSEPPVMSSSPPVAGGAFICPDASFVGCTAVDPTNPEDECTTVGEPCLNGQDGEYCCLDGCPRNYCTAKQAPMMTTAQLSEVEMFVAPLPTDF